MSTNLEDSSKEENIPNYKRVNPKTGYPFGLKVIGNSLYVDTDITVKEVLTFQESPLRYISQCARKFDGFLRDLIWKDYFF